MSSPLTFSHEDRSYVFMGRMLPLPEPGTYDASKWTPPTHQYFRVIIQDDGMWQVKYHGAVIASGDGAKRSRKNAKALIEQHCKLFLQ
jgi:hypothetical protein